LGPETIAGLIAGIIQRNSTVHNEVSIAIGGCSVSGEHSCTIYEEYVLTLTKTLFKIAVCTEGSLCRFGY
jgi:hypothetical protein